MGLMYTEHNPQYFKDPYKYNPDCWSTDNIHPFAQLPFVDQELVGVHALTIIELLCMYHIGRRYVNR